MCLYTLHGEPEEGVGSPETGVAYRCELLCECWELDPSPLQEQVFLSTVTSLQP